MALHLAHLVRADVNLLPADASRLPLQEESFDAVFSFHVTGIFARRICEPDRVKRWSREHFGGAAAFSLTTSLRLCDELTLNTKSTAIEEIICRK